MTSPREEAIERLGVPRCPQCGAIGAVQASVRGQPTVEALQVDVGCCSARCAATLLDSLYNGVARIAGKKRGGVIASKQRGQQMGIWPRGRKRLAIEQRKAERDARRGR